MKRKLVVLLFILIPMLVSAQSLSVESFRLLETDLTANTYGTMERDQNGEVAALIKVVTSETGFVFDGGMMGIVKTVQKTGEIWVYVPRAIQKITITHQQYGVLRDYYFPISIDRARTYEMVLKLPYSTPVSNRSRAQYVVFKVEPRNAVVLVDNEAHTLNSEGQLSIRLNPGEHSYMVTAPSYETETGTLTVSSSRINKEIHLSSLVGELTIRTDDDAQLYINDEFSGYGTWNGSLNEGTYYVEVRRPSYKNAYQEVTLRRSEKREVTIRATEPAYGDVEVVSDPLDFDIYIDGEKQGVTPDYITFVRAGTHVVSLRKPEYFDRNITVEVFEDSIAFISVSDFQRIPESAKDKKKREAREAKLAKDLAKAEAKARREIERDAALLAAEAAKEAAKEADSEAFKNISLQNQVDKSAFPDVYEVADVMPVYPLGNAALIQFFKDNLECPQYYQGKDRVVVSFIVEKDGFITNPYIVKGVDDVIDEEVLRVLNKMPRWTPGINDGRIVRTWQTVNINIRNRETSSASVGNGEISKSILKRKQNARNTFYVGGYYTPGELKTYGTDIGFYLNNFNFEVDYGFHNRQISGTWLSESLQDFSLKDYNNTWKYKYTWKFDYSLSLKLGYGIKVTRHICVTPQVGMALTQLKCVNDELMIYQLKVKNTSSCMSAQGAAKVELNLLRHMSVFATPSYTFPLKMGDTATRLEKNGNIIKPYIEGFKLDCGLNFLF